MKLRIIKIIAFFKGLIIVARPHIYLGWLKFPLSVSSNTLSLSKWVSQQDTKSIPNDYYTPGRDFTKRYGMYQKIVDNYNLKDEDVNYLEFGVCGAHSFKWWLEHNTNPNSRFYGFDTFEGLPEDWGIFKKGEMNADVPQLDDTRVEFIKGLFQDTLGNFIKTHNMDDPKRKIIHLDADLFSSTLFVLTSLAPYLHKGDILLFDEFNVPNHEFLAFKMFTESYYIKTKLIAAVNNYFQTAFMIE